jgi:MFS family permease
MRLPPALVPLRNGTFRTLWFASVVVWLGTWLQNTGAGWLMTTLAPRPFIVAMVQAATIMPVFLLALPGGAMADIVDRRLFLIGTQVWTVLAAGLLAALTLTGGMTAGWLLILTFAIGIGSALTAPAWSAIIPELVPREDLVGAITLNGIGYNLTRAIGPALAGFLILLGGSGLTFSLYTVSILSVIGALIMWRRDSRRFTGLPREHLFSAMRAGMRFVRNTPAIQHAMIRTIAFSIPASAPWALLPLYVRRDLLLGPGMYGVILGMMGVGGVTSGMLLPMVRGKLSRGATVVTCSLFSCAGMPRSRRPRNWSARPGCGRAPCRSTSWRRTAR